MLFQSDWSGVENLKMIQNISKKYFRENLHLKHL